MAGEDLLNDLITTLGSKIELKPLTGATKKIGKLSQGMYNLGLMAAKAAVQIGVNGVNAASQFEAAMEKVRSVTGMADQQLQQTRVIAKNLYSQNLGKDWDDLGDAIVSTSAVTKQTGASLQETTRDALLLRDTFGVGIGDSAKTAKTMMDEFGISSKQAFNLMAQGMQRGLDVSGEMTDKLGEVAPQFKSLGFGASDMFDLLAAGAKEGSFDLGKLADAVNTFNGQAGSGNAASIQGFRTLGLDAQQMMATFAAGGPAAKGAFTDIVKKIGEVADPVQRNAVAVDLFGLKFDDLKTNVISAMAAVNQQFDASKNTIDDLAHANLSKPGEALNVLGRQIDAGILLPIGEKLLPFLKQIGSQLGQFLTSHKPQIDALGKAIGDKLGGALSAIASWIPAIFDWFERMQPGIRKFGDVLQSAFGIGSEVAESLWGVLQLFEPLIPVIGDLLADAFGALWGVLQNVGAWLKDTAGTFVQWEGFVPIVSGAVAAFIAYRAVIMGVAIWTKTLALATRLQAIWTKAVALATRLLNIAMNLNPIGLIIALIVGLATAFVTAYKKSETFRNIVNGVWSTVKSFTIGAWEGMKSIITDTIETVKTTFESTWQSITTKAKDLWNKVDTAIYVIAGTIVGLLLPSLIGMGVTAASTAAQMIGAWISVAAQSTASAVVMTLKAIPSMIASFGRLVAEAALTVARMAISWASMSAGAIAAGATFVAQAALIVGRWVWMGAQSMYQAAKMAAAWVIGLGPIAWITAAVGGLTVLIISNWDTVRTFTVNIWNSIITWLATTMESVKSTVTGAWDSLVLAVTGVGERIQSALTAAWDGVKSGVISAVNWIIDKVNGLITGINNNLSVSIFGKDIGVHIPTIPPIPDGSHANGLASVPFDGYLAELHKGERVLTAAENKQYSPAIAPARTAPSGSNSKHEISLKVDITGSASGTIDRSAEARLRQLMEDTFASALRRMGLEGT